MLIKLFNYRCFTLIFNEGNELSLPLPILDPDRVLCCFCLSFEGFFFLCLVHSCFLNHYLCDVVKNYFPHILTPTGMCLDS